MEMFPLLAKAYCLHADKSFGWLCYVPARSVDKVIKRRIKMYYSFTLRKLYKAYEISGGGFAHIVLSLSK